MRTRTLVAIGATLLLAGAGLFATRAEPIPDADTPAPIVFVCRNGVAMSVWSAAYFNRLAAARGLPERAIGRAATPSFTAVPLRMVLALALDGFRLAGYRPRVISGDDARAAEIVVAIDTDLPEDVRSRSSAIEVWNGFPPMRERYFASREALEANVETLVERLALTRGRDRTAAAPETAPP